MEAGKSIEDQFSKLHMPLLPVIASHWEWKGALSPMGRGEACSYIKDIRRSKLIVNCKFYFLLAGMS